MSKRRIECKTAVKFIPSAEKCLPPPSADDTEGDVIMDEEEEEIDLARRQGEQPRMAWCQRVWRRRRICVGTRRGG